MRRSGEHWEGFDMLNRIEESVVSPGTQVLALDCESAEVANPFRSTAFATRPSSSSAAPTSAPSSGTRQTGTARLAYWAAKAPVDA